MLSQTILCLANSGIYQLYEIGAQVGLQLKQDLKPKIRIIYVRNLSIWCAAYLEGQFEVGGT